MRFWGACEEPGYTLEPETRMRQRGLGQIFKASPYRVMDFSQRAGRRWQELCQVGVGWTKAGVKQEDHRREAEGSVGQTMMSLRQTWAGIAKMDSRTA